MAGRMTGDGLVEAIVSKILGLVWHPGETIPPVRALAQSFGVARATMDAAIRHASRLGLLKTQPRQAVRVAPGAMAAAKALTKTWQRDRAAVKIGILLPQPHETGEGEFYDALADLVAVRARKRGWTAERLLWSLVPRPGLPRQLVDRGCVGAFCVVTQPERLMPLHFMRERQFPVVVFNRRFLNLPLPAVMFDDYGAAQQVGSLLYGLGHRRITFVTLRGPAHEHFDNRQIAGWLDFCRQHDLFAHWEEPVYVICHPDPMRALRAYLRRRPAPSAVVLASPALVAALADQLEDLQLRIPQELSVVGWECPAHGAAGRCPSLPELTCVRMSVERMVACSLEMLDQMIKGGPYPPPIRLPCTIVSTDSVGPPASS